MSKKNTKVEIINTINQVYYSIPNAIKYNAFVESGAFDDFKSTHENMTGQSPPKELVKKFYYEKVEPKLDDIKKIGMISGVIGYVMGEVDRRIDVAKEHKQNFRRLQTLIKGCDTLEKLKMLRELPIMKEEDSDCDCDGCDCE